MRYVIDTNVLITGTRSKNGAGFVILSKMIKKEILYYISGSLLYEYEDVLTREKHLQVSGLSNNDIDILLNVIAKNGIYKAPAYTWRPQLNDPKDEMVLDLAVAARADIVTYNAKDFKHAAKQFGINIIEPKTLVKKER